jgi:glycosyltransferase involved in cell wall biosynthesis
MNILVANWTWYPSGGDWTYIENLCKLYQQNGHKIIPFSMKDEKNYPTPYSKYFIKNIDYNKLNDNKSFINSIKVISKSLYSFEAKRSLQKLLNENKIDLAHLNNIHHYLTTSIVKILNRYQIPIIWTLHDYSNLCPNTTFVSKNKICERCKKHKYYNCVLNKCKKNSYLASIPAALESSINHLLNPYKYIDYFICPSEFIKLKFIEYGFDKNKLKVINNCFDISTLDKIQHTTENREKYILYIGNLSNIKGVKTLIQSVEGLPIKLKILGDGEHANTYREYCNLSRIKNVEFLGKVTNSEVFKYLSDSLFTICPSEWYENYPYSIVESMLLGKPVIGSNIGGIPELIVDQLTGLLFEPGNANDLSEKINKLYNNEILVAQYGHNAKLHITKLVNYENHYEELKKFIPNL